MKDLVNKPHL